jgi:hypothetical protein
MKTKKYYDSNPEAYEKKKKYDKEYHSTEERKKYRAFLNKKNRQVGKYGNGDGLGLRPRRTSVYVSCKEQI